MDLYLLFVTFLYGMFKLLDNMLEYGVHGKVLKCVHKVHLLMGLKQEYKIGKVMEIILHLIDLLLNVLVRLIKIQ
jgi:hypothetical protein